MSLFYDLIPDFSSLSAISPLFFFSFLPFFSPMAGRKQTNYRFIKLLEPENIFYDQTIIDILSSNLDPVSALLIKQITNPMLFNINSSLLTASSLTTYLWPS